MPGLTELLDDAVGRVVPGFDPGDVSSRARRRHRAVRVRRAIAGVVVLALVTGAAVLVTRGGGTTRITTPVTPPSRGVFPDTTRTVLALSDGYDGATFVDLDHRIAVRRPIDGERAGDQPYRLTRVGNALVVGWGDVYAAPLDGGPSKLLGHATYYVPAADAGAVWLIDYSGGAIGQGTSTFREVDRAGRVLVETPGPDVSLGYPAIGIPGGIAFETEQGVALWNAASGQVTATLGSVPRLPTFVSDSHGDLLAWCETTCDLFHITRLAPSGPVDLPILPPHQTTFDARAARFSPDGGLLATTGGGWITLVDTATGAPRNSFRTQAVAPSGLPPYLEWSSDGKRLFFTAYSYVENTTTVGEYVLATGETHVTTLPFGGALQGTALSHHDARALCARTGAASACVPPTVQPSGRKSPCGFKF